MNLFSGVDILLDTFPYSGTTTSCHALYNSIPIVTLYNKDYHAHNVTSSILINSNLSEFVAYSEEEYVNNMALIEDDDDLSEQEKQIIRNSFLQEKHAFCELFNKLDTVLDMFSNIPGNFFNEKLKYAITVKTILQREKNLPSYV